MLWMCIWVHPHRVMPVQVGGFLGNWGRPEPKWCWYGMLDAPNPYRLHPTSILDLVMLQCHGWGYNPLLWTASYIHIGFIQRVLADMLWMSMGVHPLGENFQEIGVDLSPSYVGMACLMLQTPIDCIQHPYWMYIKCFSTLICYEWAYGSTLTLLSMC